MTIATKLPTMSDADLATLHANSRRLVDGGTPAQRTAAAALMPAITTELAARSDALAARKAESLALRRASKGKAAAAAAG